jgi:uncharacterized BrkB/YihY/UPF0761 family membrane protein
LAGSIIGMLESRFRKRQGITRTKASANIRRVASASLLRLAASRRSGSFLAEFARNYVTTYAGLASVMIALVFLYMIASIFIFGGELNAAILGAKRKRDGNLKVERARGSW